MNQESVTEVKVKENDSEEIIDCDSDSNSYNDFEPQHPSCFEFMRSCSVILHNMKRNEMDLKNNINLDHFHDHNLHSDCHDPNKSYQCYVESCNKLFADHSSLRKHIQTHGDKQFICRERGCGKRFLDNSKLKRHQLVHTGEKPFKCDICGKRFSLDFNLRTHIRTHTGEKPYVCSFPTCGKRFTQSSNLTAHLKTHSGKEQGYFGLNENSELIIEEVSKENEESEISESKSEYSEDTFLPLKIFSVTKIPKQSLPLMRNKIPKVFWINKVKQPRLREFSSFQEEIVEDDEDSYKKDCRDVYKNERLCSFKRRHVIRSSMFSKFQQRISNDYSSQVCFKIEKIKRQLIKPFALKRYPNKQKVCDVISTSTKRSSRESSKNKIKNMMMLPPLHLANVNLIKIQNDEESKEDQHRLIFEDKPIDRDLSQVEFLKADIQTFKFEEQFEEEIEIPKAVVNQVNIQLQFESISSYHEQELEEAYKEASKVLSYHNLGSVNHIFRERSLSGWNESEAIEGHEDNSFLFRNERETLHFEPFIAKSCCQNNFDSHK